MGLLVLNVTLPVQLVLADQLCVLLVVILSIYIQALVLALALLGLMYLLRVSAMLVKRLVQLAQEMLTTAKPAHLACICLLELVCRSVQQIQQFWLEVNVKLVTPTVKLVQELSILALRALLIIILKEENVWIAVRLDIF